MKKYTLRAEKRTAVGRKVKKLRKTGQIPATVYGKKIKSVSLVVAGEAFARVYQEAGETGLVELTVDSAVAPVLIHSVQLHPLTRAPLHVEFFQVDLKEKVKTRVPVVVVGEARAVQEKTGVLLTVLDEVEVEALPTDLPDHLSLDVSGLTAVNQELKVGDIAPPSGVTVLSDAGLTVVKISALVSKEAEAQAAEEAAAAAAATPAEGAAAEGATPTEEAKVEKKEPADAKAPAEEKKT